MSLRHGFVPATLLALAAACELAAPLAPTSEPPAMSVNAAAAAPAARMVVPVFDEVSDVNPCTGELVTITYSGTGHVHGGGDNVILQARGAVATSDGYTGTFNWTFVFIDDRVTHFRFHDTEVSNESGQRVLFAVKIDHTTWRNGEAIVSFSHTSGPRCVG